MFVAKMVGLWEQIESISDIGENRILVRVAVHRSKVGVGRVVAVQLALAPQALRLTEGSTCIRNGVAVRIY